METITLKYTDIFEEKEKELIFFKTFDKKKILKSLHFLHF